MKSRPIQYAVAVIFVVTLLFAIRHLIGLAMLHEAQVPDGSELNSAGSKTAGLKNEQTESRLNNRAKVKLEMPRPKNDQFYKIVGQSSMRIEADESEVMNRVNSGLKGLQRGIASVDEKPMSNLREAYQRLVHDQVFMDNHFPLWGIECEGYFVFSGYPGCDPKKAFRNGFAVRKANGSIFQWWLEDEE